MAYGRQVAVVASGAMVLGLAAGVPAVGASVPGGVGAAVIAADNSIPNKTKVSFYVGLDRPEEAAIKRLRKMSDPTSSSYRQFPSRKKVASKYGASTKTIKAARASVKKYGLKLHVDDTGVFARVSGTAKQMKNWVGKAVGAEQVPLPGGTVTIYATTASFPKGKAEGIREFFGYDVQSDFGGATSSLSSKNPPYDGVQTGTPLNSCLVTDPELSGYTYSVNELRTAYGLDSLPAGPKVAKAARVVILAEGDGFSDEALAMFAECFQLPAVSFDRVDVPGLTGDLPEGDEGDLDVQVVHSVLPAGSKVSVVQTSSVDMRDFLIWSTAFSLNKLPDVITTSYGSCEPQQRKSSTVGITMTESVLARLSLAGVSMFSAAGDRGSSDCVNNETGKGNTRLAVDYPGSSHHVTSVGGTRIELTAANKRADEVVWFGPSAEPPLSSSTGGGGGTSILFERPWWQPKSVTKSSMRTVPDVVAHAAETPGWPVVTLDPQVGQLALVPVGGTSAATPFTASTIGLIAANERVKGRPALGQVQPLFYHLADKKPSTFFDIVTGNNDVFDKGCCAAKKGYDKASGLGALKFDKLAQRLPKP